MMITASLRPSLTGGVGGGSLLHEHFLTVDDIDTTARLYHAATCEVIHHVLLALCIADFLQAISTVVDEQLNAATAGEGNFV